jgi:hypothetical protein
MSNFLLSSSLAALSAGLSWIAFICLTDRARWHKALSALPLVVLCGSALSFHFFGIGLPVK